ncbi:hypothetical protein K450DRAFT_274424 [Umbelopsis ramanniana AG]|uniref:G-protein coupled receptors family 2 profile 2 domain-containing protein n=1 Tax=Umbelopsis ramanniana AG TaxID=1314678 RepID=A0AAD5E4R0_UMBRA|nr:uncharacterized protein K450DRAFT_274424 [Umbelopsis ramanniana AG]KAI8576729.1 hypothetical protein K450DRAFT_274424 [Umbelopsis ramanniana AG]
MSTQNVTALYPNTPTPDLSPDSWDFDPGYNLLLPGDEANKIFTIVNLCVNSIGMFCAVMVCIILLLVRLYDKTLVDRVSLRLTAAVSTVDAVKSAAYIIFTFVATPGAACGATAWLILFLTNLYTFLSVAIAFNLQWLFLLRKRVHPWLEISYFAVSVLLALATTVPPWAAGRLGLDENYGVCWYIAYSSKKTILWEWLTFLSWNMMGTLYCFFVVVAVIFKLRKSTIAVKTYNSHTTSSKDLTSAQLRARRTQRTMNKLVLRISLYALIPIVTQLGWYISECIMQFQHYLNVGLDWYLIVTTDLPGVLNFVAFCMDPALANALRHIKEDMLEKYGEQGSLQSTPSEHRFARWITKHFLSGTKKVDDVTSPFYRMSSSQPLSKDYEPDSNSSYPDNFVAFPSATAIPVTNDSQSTMIQISEAGQNVSYEMGQLQTHSKNKPNRRKYSEDEETKRVFRGL